MKISDTDAEDRDIQGEISIRVSPYLNTMTICGELELGGIDGSSAKKYWCCLLDASLYLYARYTDTEARIIIQVFKAMSVQYVDKEEKLGRVKKKSVRYIEVKMRADEIYLLRCAKHPSGENPPTEAEWVSKLKNSLRVGKPKADR
jgi:hypothetical protein